MEGNTIFHSLYQFTISFGLLIISVEADPNIYWLYTPSEVLGLLNAELAVTLCDLNYTT